MKAGILIFALARLCISGTPPDADQFLQRAASLAAAGRLTDAEHMLHQAQLAFAADARFPAELAGIAWRRNQPQLAKAYLRQALRLDASNAYANEFLGSLYLLDGNLYAALGYLNRVHRPVLSGVVFSPGPPLRPELIARLPAVSAGQLLTVARLAQTEQNLERLGIFSDPRFDLSPGPADEYRLIVAAPPLSLPLSGAAGRLLPMLRGLPYQQINFDWLNIGQRAIVFTSLWRWDSEKRRIALRYRAPLRRGAYSLWTDLRDETWDLRRSGIFPGALGVRSAALGGEMEFNLRAGLRWIPAIQLSRHIFHDGGSEWWFANATVVEVRNRLALPRWRYPERRVRIDSSVMLRTGRFYSRAPSRLVGAEFDSAAEWLPQQRDDVYAVRARVRAGALSGHPPLDELYMTAMERDNTLWLRGHVGTRDSRKGSAPMGDRFVLEQNEVMRRLFRIPFVRIDAGPFLDFANVGGVAGLGSRGWLYDTGAQAVLTTLGGFRFSVIYGRDLRGGANAFYTAFSR